MKIYCYDAGHMTKMATMPIYDDGFCFQLSLVASD